MRQSLDTVGAFAGPLLAVGLVAGLAYDIRAVLWFACLPALLAVAVLVVGVDESPRANDGASRARNPFAGFRRRDYPLRFWGLVGLVLLFTLSRFSEAFLVLRAQDAGLATGWAPITLVVMAATYLLTAYPVGRLSDRMSRHALLAIGCAVMVAADLLLAFGSSVVWVMAGVALWGVHMGMTEGLLAALTADYAPAPLRGTAFGIVNLTRGLMLLLASVLAGGLWTFFGPQATFMGGAAFAVLTAIAALSLRAPRAARLGA